MLPDINLDIEKFDEIVEDAKNQIHTLYPEWTDYNYHDPGITLIELFAWLKEIQQYKLNQINCQHKLCYLELLGMKREHRKGSNCRIYIDAGKKILLPKKSRFYADDVVFESIKSRMLLPVCINYLIFESKDNKRIVTIGKLKEIKIREYMFTKNPVPGNRMYISFDAPLPIKKEVNLGINIYDDIVVKRRPLENGIPFEPLAEFEYEYYSKDRWHKLVILEDNTTGFLYDGNLRFILEAAMTETKVFEKEGYFIRITLKDCEYEIPPMITGISLNMIELKQQETLTESLTIAVHRIKGNTEVTQYSKDAKEILNDNLTIPKEEITVNNGTWLSIYGDDIVLIKHQDGYDKTEFNKQVDYKRMESLYTIPIHKDISIEEIKIVSFADKAVKFMNFFEADGLPNQRYDLEDNQISYDDFEIMIKEDDGKYYDWKKVEAFYDSSPRDRHYILDGDSSSIIFGDGIKGRLPKGSISLISYSRTMGDGGNVKPHTINRSGYADDKMYIYHEDAGIDGRNEEELNHVFHRFKKKLIDDKALLSAKDYEKAVINMHGLLIESCRAIYDKKAFNQVILIVKPKSDSDEDSYEKDKHMNKQAGKRYVSNILNYLEDKRTLGTEIIVVYPEYIGIMLYADITVSPYCREPDVKIKKAVTKYFKTKEKELTKLLYYSRIYGLIDSLLEVVDVKSLRITALDSDIPQNDHGDLLFSLNKVPRLVGIQLRIRITEASTADMEGD